MKEAMGKAVKEERQRESEIEITISIFRVERLWAGESFEI
jgi:hypothetical protein